MCCITPTDAQSAQVSSQLSQAGYSIRDSGLNTSLNFRTQQQQMKATLHKDSFYDDTEHLPAAALKCCKDCRSRSSLFVTLSRSSWWGQCP